MHERDFNPHTREGCDDPERRQDVSFIYFNPHTREGCDSTGFICRSGPEAFQSTHPRRVRPIYSWSLTPNPYFNPHTREGCDAILHKLSGHQEFQSTHPRRVRLFIDSLERSPTKFQSTHPRRVRRLRFHSIHYESINYFNPHTREGCDSRFTWYLMRFSGNFNPHTREGCDYGEYPRLVRQE